MPDERPRGGPAPVVNQAIEREFNALREFLAQLEQSPPGSLPHPAAGAAPGSTPQVRAGTTVIGHSRRDPAPAPRPPRPTGDQVVYWWVVVHWVTLLPTVAALRERLAALPGAIAAQVIDISSREIRLGVITTPQVTREQLEFAVTACHDIPAAEIMLRTPRRAV